MPNLTAYGPGYDPATHTWPTGVRPTGPACRACGGRGETESTLNRPVHTTHPGPGWEPYEPDTAACRACDGTGVRPPAGVL